jgi:hypothetical protein
LTKNVYSGELRKWWLILQLIQIILMNVVIIWASKPIDQISEALHALESDEDVYEIMWVYGKIGQLANE